MIFILLGIIILIAAFVIALVSLIREQKNSSVNTHLHEKIDELEVKVREKEEAAAVVPEEAKTAFQPEEREPFPWETAQNADVEVKAEPIGTEQERMEPEFGFRQTAEPPKEGPTESDELPSTQDPTNYNPSLPAGGVVEISMKDMIEGAKNSEGS